MENIRMKILAEWQTGGIMNRSASNIDSQS